MDIQNVYAYNIKDEEIHISEAESGKKGYFCMGCKREMQAVKQSKENRRSFFRHDHNALKGEGLCTFSDETYRHQIAKQYLINVKKVKVPAVYKFPPKDFDGIANLISKEKYIEASFVIPELSFYEDDAGVIHYEKVFPSSEMYNLLIRPDITFFDSQSKPILLIELVATHKLGEEKKIKIKHLGIDCIQVTVPKDSPENIEKVFDRTNRTKWIYNYEHESAEYIPITYGSREGISFIDKDQRKFFEESFNCRAAQIRNLIRTIDSCLESEQYRKVTEKLESEISRVTRNTEIERKDLERTRSSNAASIEEFRDGIRTKINSKYQSDIERIHNERNRIDAEEQQLQEHIRTEDTTYASRIEEYRGKYRESLYERHQYNAEKEQIRYRELEERYNRKKSEIIGIAESTEDSNRELRRKIEDINTETDGIQFRLTRIGIEKSRIEDDIKGEKRVTNQLQLSIQPIVERRNRITEKGIFETDKVEEGVGSDRREIEKRIEQLREQFIASVEDRPFTPNEYTRRHQTTLDELDKISDYISAKRAYEKYEKAWRSFTKGAFENWND